MESKEHSDLEQWAQKFGGTAILGFISTLLLAGKFLHHIFQRRGLVFGILVIPPALLSGIIGLAWFSGMEFLDPVMTLDLRLGLEALKGNLINYVFAALILGITCSRAHSQHNASFRGILTSLFHEGMPMVIYSQLLNWGQTTCCLLLVCVANSFFNAKIPSVFAAMVPLGLEAGADVTVSSSYKTDWTNTIVEEAESLGILCICTMGVLMFTFKPYFIAQGWLGKGYLRSAQGAGSAGTLHLQHGTGQAEAFMRATSRNPLSSHSASSGALRASLTASRSFSNFGHSVPGTPAVTDGDRESPSSRDKTLSFDEEGNDLILTQEPGKSNNASLGAHLALIALTAFLSFGVSLMFHLLEIQLGLTTHWLSGVRMFKLTMCCAMLSMVAILQRSQIKFNRDWFMHMCGLMLDLLVIASLSKAHPKPKVMEQTHYLLCSMFVVVCLLWNIFCFLFVARSLFPNYWFERALTLAGDSMGHSYTGLLFARTLDPTMESPVPAAYAYKLLLFFIPSSGAKQTIVASTMASSGPWAAFFTCLFVVFAWLFIFDSYFRRRFVSTKDKARDAQGDDEATHSLISGSAEGNGGGTMAPVSDDEIELTGRDSANTKRRSVVNQQTSKSFHDLIEDAAAQGDHSHTRDLGLELSADHSGEIEPSPQQRLRAMTVAYNVHASEASSIISQSQMNTIASFLSNTNCAKSWQLTYSLRQHGASMNTLLSLTSKKTRSGQRSLLPCVMVIEDSWGYIFGGFISPNIRDKTAYYGNGECFVYSLVPAPQVYKWTGKNELFVLSNGNCFAMGGGGDGYAIQLDDELDTGVSNRSDTFENKVLSSSEFFKCLNIEVWTLDGGFSV